MLAAAEGEQGIVISRLIMRHHQHMRPEDLARMRRLCLQVAQRHRNFGNFAELFLNWYPTIHGYWETNPPCDGHADDRRALLQKETDEVWKSLRGDRQLSLSDKDLKTLVPIDAKYRSEDAETLRDSQLHSRRYYNGCLPRAYAIWLEGMRDIFTATADHDVMSAPGLRCGEPVFTSFVPVGWFRQSDYYPPQYFATLPVAGIHAYTDYGYAPFQPYWGIDFYGAGLGSKPIWVATMSDGRASMLAHALLCAARGADGLDICGQDANAARAIFQFLSRYGPAFRLRQPLSEVRCWSLNDSRYAMRRGRAMEAATQAESIMTYIRNTDLPAGRRRCSPTMKLRAIALNAIKRSFLSASAYRSRRHA